MSDRSEPVLAAALDRLIGDGTLTREQADAISSAFHTGLGSERANEGALPRQQTGASWSPILAEVGGYIGTAFVVAAAVALVGPGWDNFSPAVRVLLLAGPAVLLLIAATAVAVARPGFGAVRSLAARREAHRSSGGDEYASAAIRRLIGALVLAGGGLLGAATAVITDDGGSQDWIPVVALVVWGLGYLVVRGVPLHLGTAVALVWTVFTVIDANIDEQFPLTGAVLVLSGVGWALLAQVRWIQERALAIAVAGVMAFIGGEYATASDYEALGYLFLGLLAAAGLAGYLRTHELSALGVGAVALAVVIPQVVIDYTEGSLGTAGALLVSGLSVVTASVLAARLRRADSGPTQLM